ALHSREAQVEYSPFSRLSVGGSLKVSAETGSEARAAGFTATVKPLQFLEIGGGVRMREATKDGIPDPTVPDTYNVRLSVGLPKNLLKLTGGYASNPEDDHGTVAR